MNTSQRRGYAWIGEPWTGLRPTGRIITNDGHPSGVGELFLVGTILNGRIVLLQGGVATRRFREIITWAGV